MLAHLDEDNERRREVADAYNVRLAGSTFALPSPAADTRHVYHQYVIRSPRRDDLRAFLAERGVNTLVHYPVPVHLQPAYQGRLALAPGGLPVTEQICGEILSLPMHPHLTDEQVQAVCDALLAFDT
jgi:dTDP-4-amino-4,6-dideoxygalactose transaminase